MSERDAFGPNLRRLRVQRGISLERIAEDTKVSVDLWDGLERNDFSRWPTGIYARSYIRAYAEAIGADPNTAVDDFCRWFPQGDRRAGRIVREQAEIVGHRLQWEDDLIPAATRDRRAKAELAVLPTLAFSRAGRSAAALVDITAIFGIAAGTSSLLRIGLGPALGLTAIVYHAASLVSLGSSPAVWALDTYLANRKPAAHRAAPGRVLRMLRNSER